MSLDSIVNISITTTTTAPSQAGFGTPLIMAYHTHNVDRVRTYTSLAGMVADSFTATEPAYLAAQAVLSQNPRPTSIMIGREANTAAKTVKVTPTAVNSTLYSLTVDATTYQYLSDGTATVAEITAAFGGASPIKTGLNCDPWANTTGYVLYDHVTNGGNVYRCTTAGTSAGAGGPTGTGSAIQDNTVVWAYAGPDTVGVTGTDGTTDFTITATGAATWFELNIADRTLMIREDLTTDAGGSSGIVADIQAVNVVSDDWYSIHLTNQSEAVINAAAAHIETLKKIMVVTCGNDEIYDASITDCIASDLYAADYARTAIIYHHQPESFPCCAWAGVMLPKKPGAATWNFKGLTGITYNTYTSTEITAMDGKRANYFTRISGLNRIQHGYTASGEWLDTARGSDWIRARMQERIWGVLGNRDKVPMTDGGIASIVAEVDGQLQEGVTNTFFTDNPIYVVTFPDAADISAANKANRLLPDVEFVAYLAGAVHAVQITGVISL